MIPGSITRTLQVILLYVKENPTVIPMLLVWIITNAQVFILGVERTDRANPAPIQFVVLWCIRIAHIILFESRNGRDNPTPMGIILKWIKETVPIVNSRGKVPFLRQILTWLRPIAPHWSCGALTSLSLRVMTQS
jgi:hypothetical protein